MSRGRKLVYWVARSYDSSNYSARARTRKECLEQARDAHGADWEDHYEPPKKVTFTYYGGAFEAIQHVLQDPTYY